MAKKLVSFTGTIDRILWRAKDSPYSFVRLKNAKDSQGQLEDSFVCKGDFADLKPGMVVRGKGSIVRNAKKEKEIKVHRFTVHFPYRTPDIITYLQGKQVPYLPNAKSILNFLYAANGGDIPGPESKALEILAFEPERIKIEGYSPAVVAEMSAALNSERNRLNYINELVSMAGFDRAKAIHLTNVSEGNPVDYFAQHPYESSIALGLPFKVCDNIAHAIGWDEEQRPKRILAAASEVFGNEIGHGSTVVPYDRLISGLTDLLGSPEQADEAINALRYSNIYRFTFSEDNNFVQSTRWSGIENEIGRELKRLTEAAPLFSNREWTVTEEAHQSNDASDQRKAIKGALSANVSILTGGPGTGKTTTVKTILSMLEDAGKSENRNLKFSLSAPSGLASKRLTDSTKREASTIHKNLQMTHTALPGRNKQTPMDADVVVIDESSMLDAELFLKALQATPTGAKVLLVGDPDQLPSVGAGNVLEDLIKAGNPNIPSTKLAKVFRNAGPIAHNAHAINRGEMPEVLSEPVNSQAPGQAWNVWMFKSDQEKLAMVEWLVKTELPQNYGFDYKDIQVLSPQHAGILGTENLNKAIQAAVNPMGPGKKEMRLGSLGTYRTGDKIIYLSNTPSKALVNGDIGYIDDVDAGKRSLTATFGDKTVSLKGKDLYSTKLAYCVTIHKSQGSEYPVAILPMSSNQHWTRQLYYTGITRCKSHAFSLTDHKTLSTAVNDSKRVIRQTGLATAVNAHCTKGTTYECIDELGIRQLNSQPKKENPRLTLVP